MKLADLDKINQLVTTLSQLDRIARELKDGTVVPRLWHRGSERTLSIASTISEDTEGQIAELLQQSIREQSKACLEALADMGVEP
jgi:hypothetical protein